MINWLQHKWHARLRKFDRRYLIPALVSAASASSDEGAEDWKKKRIAAFVLHTQMPGNEHWLCDCGIQERNEVIDWLG